MKHFLCLRDYLFVLCVAVLSMPNAWAVTTTGDALIPDSRFPTYVKFHGDPNNWGTLATQARVNAVAAPTEQPFFMAGFLRPEDYHTWGGIVGAQGAFRQNGTWLLTMGAYDHSLYGFMWLDVSTHGAYSPAPAIFVGEGRGGYADAAYALNQWQFSAYVITDRCKRQVFTDGVWGAASTDCHPWPTGLSSTTFGSYYDVSQGGADAHVFNGGMRNWAIVKGTPTAAELTRMRNGEDPRTIWGAANVWGYWAFTTDPSTGAQEPDLSGNGNHLTYIGGGTVNNTKPTLVTPTAPSKLFGLCGGAHGASTNVPPTQDLCYAGSNTPVTGTGPWTWTCNGANGGASQSCAAPVVGATNGQCGSANGVAVNAAPTGGLCGSGTASAVTGSGPWSWTCNGTTGGTSASCSAPKSEIVPPPPPPPVNGQCGSANSIAVRTAPTASLCSSGSASSVTGSGPWNWSCGGSNGGTTASCSAPLTSGDNPTGGGNPAGGGGIPSAGPSSGACGAINGVPTKRLPSIRMLCSKGTILSLRSTSTGWQWTCGVRRSSLPPTQCSTTKPTASCPVSSPASVIPVSSLTAGQLNRCTTNVSGACGPTNGTSVANTPTTGLCLSGSASAVTGTGPWTWSCVGIGTGSTASCQANKTTSVSNGVCGSANGTSVTSAPATGLCSVGNASAVNGSGPWSWSCVGLGGGSTASCNATLASITPIDTGYVSPAALNDQATVCTGQVPFPTQWQWDPAKVAGQQPRAATDADGLTPKIEQVRDGKVIATWQYLGAGTCGGIGFDAWQNPQKYANEGCGPFGRSHYFQSWLNGDTFLVYPAVYNANDDRNQPFIAPNFASEAQYNAGIGNTPENITIKGVTVNGIRPVFRVESNGAASNTTLGKGIFYIGGTKDLTISNLDIQGVSPGGGYAAIYLNGGHGTTTFSQMRIGGFASANMNGIFGTIGSNSGTLWLDQVELYDNGGVQSGAMHNVYINTGVDSTNYTVKMTNSWSHAAHYGHTFKSRASTNILEGNYFGGGSPTGPEKGTDSYLVDIPNGGQLVMKNNIFVKNKSQGNAMSFAYLMEGIIDTRKHSVDAQHNTFVALAKYYDDANHPLYPASFGYQASLPDANGWLVPAGTSYNGPYAAYQIPAADFKYKNNAFVGYCSTGYPGADYHGDLSVVLGFSELNKDFSLTNKRMSPDTSIIGTRAYQHVAQPGFVRTQATIGAKD